MCSIQQDDQVRTVTTRRARQACENCRRKKSKCPGEKPECSFCLRLGQRCIYARHYRVRGNRDQEPARGLVDAPVSDDSQRLSIIENRLDQLVAVLEAHQPEPGGLPACLSMRRQERQASWNSTTIPSPSSLTTNSVATWPRLDPSLQIPETVISGGIDVYFDYYCDQPCPILAHMKPVQRGNDVRLPEIVLYPLLALSLRSYRHSFFDGRSKRELCIRELTKLSWSFLTKAYGDYSIDDAYFQGLCLLVQVDTGDGRLDRAQAQIALGLRLAQSRGMLSAHSLDNLEPVERVRRQEIVWSLFILDRMCTGGAARTPSIPASAFELPVIQYGPAHPDQTSQPFKINHPENLLESEMSESLHSIRALNVQALRTWECVLAEITQPCSNFDTPLWSHESSRAAVLTRILDFETGCSRSYHNYAHSGPPTRVIEEPRLKDYFNAWLHFQLILSAIHCCLNHPFIIYAKTSKLKRRVPLTFLQKSYEYSLIHANWVFRLLNDMDDAGLELHNPFVGHMVAIAASIHLEHSLNQHSTVSEPAEQKFEKCLNSVRKLGDEWVRMRVTFSILKQLESRTRHRTQMNYVEEGYNGAVPSSVARQVLVEEEDEKLMWKLFDYGYMDTNLSASSTSRGDWFSTANDLVATSNDTGSSAGIEIFGQDTQNSALDNAPDQHAANIFLGTVSGFGTPDATYGDWSLFGKSWMDYFP